MINVRTFLAVALLGASVQSFGDLGHQYSTPPAIHAPAPAPGSVYVPRPPRTQSVTPYMNQGVSAAPTNQRLVMKNPQSITIDEQYRTLRGHQSCDGMCQLVFDNVYKVVQGTKAG